MNQKDILIETTNIMSKTMMVPNFIAAHDRFLDAVKSLDDGEIKDSLNICDEHGKSLLQILRAKDHDLPKRHPDTGQISRPAFSFGTWRQGPGALIYFLMNTDSAEERRNGITHYERSYNAFKLIARQQGPRP